MHFQYFGSFLNSGCVSVYADSEDDELFSPGVSILTASLCLLGDTAATEEISGEPGC